MPKLFGVDIQKIVSDAIPSGPKGLPSVTLRKLTNSVRDPSNLSAGPVITYEEYVTRGVATTYTLREANDAPGVQVGDKKIVVIARPLDKLGVVPSKQDEIIVQGETLTIVWVMRDPAVATYVIAARG